MSVQTTTEWSLLCMAHNWKKGQVMRQQEQIMKGYQVGNHCFLFGLSLPSKIQKKEA